MRRHIACAMAAILLIASGPLRAHEGEHHASPSAAIDKTTAGGVRWLSADELFVPKSLQHALGVRTVRIDPADATAVRRLFAELVPDPASPGVLAATQIGRLVAASRWPLSGQVVTEGEILAWLQPVLPQRDDAARRTRLAEREEALRMAQINAERLRVQASASEGEVNTANIYREKAEMDLDAARRQRDLAAQALQGRVAVRAPFAGTLLSVAVREGERVAPGQPLFELADPARLQVALMTLDASLARRVRDAALIGKDGVPIALRLRGEEALGEQPGWRLTFEFADAVPSAFTVGEIATVELRVEASDAVSAASCIREANGVTAWQHVAAERFRRVRLASCAQLGTIAGDGRWVSAGAALLSQYR